MSSFTDQLISHLMQSLSAEYVAGRKECVQLAMSHAGAFGFKDEVLHDAVLLVDRTMSSGIALPPAMLPLLVAACILISARQGQLPSNVSFPATSASQQCQLLSNVSFSAASC